MVFLAILVIVLSIALGSTIALKEIDKANARAKYAELKRDMFFKDSVIRELQRNIEELQRG